MLLTSLLLLAAQDPETAVDAERAFNRAAQTQGQWTAFRQFMTDDAVVFTPQPEKAKDSLPTREPKIAIQWWPAESYVSCDGAVAVNTGPWLLPKAAGYFTTVWVRQADGHYKWVYDGGDGLTAPRALPEQPKVAKASCAGHPIVPARAKGPAEDKAGDGRSPDGTLIWAWTVKPDGSRLFDVHLWNGTRYKLVLQNDIAASQ